MTSQVWKAMKGVQFVLVAYVISIAAFAYAYNANSVAVKEANNRAAQFKAEAEARSLALENQSIRLRYAFCGLQPYAQITTPAPTESARTLREVIQKAVSPQGLNCSPDPNDGQ
jgi:hypothetical protein